MSEKNRRRGIALLVVLSLLVLFTILMATFLIVAGQYRLAARATSRSRQQVIDPKELLDQSFFTLLRDTPNARSVVRGHSLLLDMYGLDGFKGTVLNSGPVGFFSGQADATGGQFFDLRLNTPLPPLIPPNPQNVIVDLIGNSYWLQNVDGYYNGCILTTVATTDNSVSARSRIGLSYRIVSYSSDPTTPAAADHVFRVMSTTPDGGSFQAPLQGDTVVINGRPFNGSGFGYDRDAASTRYQKLNTEALLPNQYGQSTSQFISYLAGDADEGYDATDFQNMALAAVIPSDASVIVEGLNVPALIIPSFHRPDLVNYWLGIANGNSATWISVRDSIVLRPMPWSNPLFTGGNSQLTFGTDGQPGLIGVDDDGNGTTDRLADGTPDANEFCALGSDDLVALQFGPWDVDTDGDGIKDSVWLDLDFPLQTTPDGRLVKPLFAINCQELDSRLNLNAHGSFNHIHNAAARPARITDTTTLARSVSSTTLPKGRGYGPVEIYLGILFGNTPYQRLLQGDIQTGLRGRYGDDGQPGMGAMDNLATIKFFDIPSDYFNNLGAVNPTGKSYNSVPDLSGELAVGLDYRGQPTTDRPSAAVTDTLSNSPYEVDLSQNTSRGLYNQQPSGATPVNDQPFSVAELERVLRYHDPDVGYLPDRLETLLSNTGTANPFTTSTLAAANRRIVTTDSYDLPVPAVVSPFGRAADFEGNSVLYPAGRPLNYLDFIRQRHFAPLGIPAGTSATAAQLTTLNNLLGVLVSPDLAMGLKMDINRPFGNGVDDNGNNVVDEHGPVSAAQLEAAPAVGERIWLPSIYFDHDNDGNTTTDTDAYLARYHFARHLYVLAMTFRNNNGSEHLIDFEGDGLSGTPSVNEFETARGLAQWAANVVDFRDADSIMTPFEFDANPFDGWSVDGDPSTNETNGVNDDGDSTTDEPDERLVWGCERPEILITENVAIHDRRTEDLDSEPSGTKTDDTTTPDSDYDQRLSPIGRFFVELYNPWTGDQYHPAEFYTANVGVELNRRAPISAAIGAPLTGAPVWRMIVVGGTSHTGDALGPYDPDGSSDFLTTDVLRGIYFTDPSTVPPLANEVRHYSDLPMAPLLPGCYAVVGSGVQNGADYIATIGRRTDASDDGQTAVTTNLLTGTTRRIVMTPNNNPAVQQVQVLDNGAASTPADIQPTIAAVINQGGNLNISEPPAGYPVGNWDPALASGEGAFNPTYDEPFDATLRGRDANVFDILDNVNPTAGNLTDRNAFGANVLTIYLQRLANPLVPWDAVVNPYRTVDRAPIDLTVFEGVWDPANAMPSPGTNSAEPCGGRERGDTTNTRVLWSVAATPPDADQVAAGDTQVFNYLLDSTLGYLNESYGNRFTSSDPVPTSFYGAPKTTTAGVDGEPFPWLTWNNRPFSSQYEMLWVPYTRSSRLLQKFSLAQTSNPYSADSAVPPLGPNQPAIQFPHLLNLFETSGEDSVGTIAGSDLYWILEYTHVPSRFVGAEEWLNPVNFAGGTGTELRHPPFNKVPRFREPGKVNPNNVFDDRVWNALLGPPYSNNGPSSTAWADSRRGYTGSGIVDFQTAQPTLFGNPLRPVGYGHLVPLATMERTESECDLLRSVRSSASAQPPGEESPALPGSKEALFATTATGTAAIDPVRNPYFRYQSIQRFANLVTPRSNVYAVWTTVGFFEVDPTTGQLRQEAGIETGEVQRHRAFYVFDRTIPVAFEPGENHNVERAILLKRFIE